jgi:hypothetical protein
MKFLRFAVKIDRYFLLSNFRLTVLHQSKSSSMDVGVFANEKLG